MTRRLARATRLAAFVTCSLLTLGATTAGAGAATVGGTATVTHPTGGTMFTGGSTKPFTLSLPRKAACSGPSRAGSHVYSYLVQHGTDVASVRFSSTPSAGYGLFDATNGDYFGGAATDRAGRIASPPTFDWAHLLPNGSSSTKAALLYRGSSGLWDGGIVCVNARGHVTDSWNFGVLFTASHTDPHGFAYCVVPTDPAELPEVPYAAALPFVGLAVIGGYVVIRRRRAQTRTETPA